ncbi:MAG: transglycosylase SLT domain-containing protein [Bacteroidota bacterium]
MIDWRLIFVGISCFLGAIPSFGQLAPTPKPPLTEIVVHQNNALHVVVNDSSLYQERWDTLSQIRFWRRIMTMDSTVALLSIAKTRQVLNAFPSAIYEAMETEEKRHFKDSLLKKYKLPSYTRLYVTYGKQDYYQIRETLPIIDQCVDIFQEMQVDPWYAQAILLIESPGISRTSNVGAVGHFQLMKYVAISQGLKVNAEEDEREDLEKSATAAASFIRTVCLPATRRMLRSRGIRYNERDTWFRLLALHVYHAGASNVAGALRKANIRKGGPALIQALWQTSYRGFRNASQNYSQLALATMLELDRLIERECSILCPVKL